LEKKGKAAVGPFIRFLKGFVPVFRPAGGGPLPNLRGRKKQAGSEVGSTRKKRKKKKKKKGKTCTPFLI